MRVLSYRAPSRYGRVSLPRDLRSKSRISGGSGTRKRNFIVGAVLSRSRWFGARRFQVASGVDLWALEALDWG
jgi:hypothetical protein